VGGIKYEEIYLFEHSTVTALRVGAGKWSARYNDWRPHEALGNLTPEVVYQSALSGPDDASETTTPEAA
jgi:putative transposase